MLGKFYDKFMKMKIDEENEQFDISDHNQVEIYMDIKRNKKAYKGEEWVVREYYKTDKDSMQRYKEELENDLRQKRVNDMADLEKIVEHSRKDTEKEIQI